MTANADNHDELLEVVDESGSVLCTAERQLVHTQGLLHKAVYCFAFDRLGRLLLQQRSAKCASSGEFDL
jgi:isopentenyl-diphosphate delta-isomerase